MCTNDIYSALGDAPMGQDQEYWDKQIHCVPESKVVGREKFILDRCKGKKVLNLGCASGTLHNRIMEVAEISWGIDKNCHEHFLIDLDKDPILPDLKEVFPQLIVAGEILEHLTNPGMLLNKLHCYGPISMIATLPNAHAKINQYWIKLQKENVNKDHVAWYSYHTAKCLFEKCGWTVSEFYWYGGKPYTAEGLIFVVV
jgi:hypothetical protein